MASRTVYTCNICGHDMEDGITIHRENKNEGKFLVNMDKWLYVENEYDYHICNPCHNMIRE